VLLPWKVLDDWFFNFLAGGNLNEDILYPNTWLDFRVIFNNVWTHYRSTAPSR